MWCTSSPVCAKVNDAMQQLTSVTYIARKRKDSAAVEKLVNFLEDTTPFDKEPDLRNIVNGVISEETKY